MIQTPDRLAALIQRLEKSEPVTQEEVDRIAALQALDLARLGREFVEQAIARQEQQLELLKE